MAKQTSLFITKGIQNPCVAILPADTTVLKALYTASADDAVVKSLMLTSSDTAIMNVVVAINNGSADFILGTVNVPATSGETGAIASVDALSGTLLPGLPYDQNGKRVLPLKGTYVLKVGVMVAVTAAKQINAVGVVEEY
jgi:hypothetical protein